MNLMLDERIKIPVARESRRSEEERELEELSAVQAELFRPLTLLPPRQRECLGLWGLCCSQRYGQGMTFGTLVHSEVWNNLEKLGYEGQEKETAFHVILGLDDVYREHVGKMEKEGDGN